ncbi:MAG: hypothetical protein JOZ07_11210 [Solirubrobacterales bacterium]|nr:hypothetical protein [Solirubrobacterales bacterium]
MTHPDYLRRRTRELRVARQLTLDELVERLALPRTTVYGWIRDLPLQRPRNSSAAQRKGTRAMQAKYRRLREDAYARGLAEYPQLVAVPTFRDFVVLYIAEGYKRSRNTASLCNSDPAVMVVAASWMRRLGECEPTLRVAHHRDQDQGALRAFWAEQLALVPAAVRFEPKTNSSELRSRTWRCPYGVAAVDLHHTEFRSRLQAWMDRVKDDWRLDSAP